MLEIIVRRGGEKNAERGGGRIESEKSGERDRLGENRMQRGGKRGPNCGGKRERENSGKI